VAEGMTVDIAVFFAVVALAVWGAVSRGWVGPDPDEELREWCVRATRERG